MTVETTDWTSPPAYVTDFVSRYRLFFHQSRWLQCYDPGRLKQALIFNKNKELIGCFLYYIFSKGPFRFIITPPYTPDLSLFFVNPGESEVGRNSFVKQLMETIGEYLDGLGVHYVSLNLPAELKDAQPLIWKKFLARSRYTYWLNLAQSEEELWKNLSPEKRKSVNKARKDGLELEKAKDKTVVLDLINASLGRNEKNKHRSIIHRIIETYLGRPDCISYLARENGRPLAVSFCVIDRNRAIYLFGGYSSEGGHHGAGVSCMWESIIEAKRNGCEIFDFEGSMNKSIERYFREFGPKLVSYQCIEKVKPFLGLLLKLKGHQPI